MCGRAKSHCPFHNFKVFLNIIFRVELNLSNMPSDSGWYGVVLFPFTPISLCSSCMRRLTKFVPQSVRISAGGPTRVKSINNSLAMPWLSFFCRRIASVHLVAKSTTTKMCLCRPFVLGRVSYHVHPNSGKWNINDGKRSQRCSVLSLMGCFLILWEGKAQLLNVCMYS